MNLVGMVNRIRASVIRGSFFPDCVEFMQYINRLYCAYASDVNRSVLFLSSSYRNKSGMKKISGPFYTVKGAAYYCAYSVDYFRHLAHQYNLPKCGPRHNRYAQSVLDQWMKHPNVFLDDQVHDAKRNFKPIEL